MAKHIVVIDPGAAHPELDTLNQLVVRSHYEYKFSYHLPAMHGLRSLELAPASIAAAIVLGSSVSVHDRLVWQDALWSWLEENIMRPKLPILGICYGHQLIASRMGGYVSYMEAGGAKFQGLRELRTNGEFGFKKTSYRIYMSHREVVSEVPPDFQVHLLSEAFVNEGLVHKCKPIWTISGHPEATLGFLENQSMLSAGAQPYFSDGHYWLQEWLALNL